MKKLIILPMLFLLIVLSGCAGIQYEAPSAFNFTLNFGLSQAANQINTHNNTLTKDLIIAGAETIEFTIPDEKMYEFYEIFVENNIHELQDDITTQPSATGVYSSKTPSNKIILTYTFNGQTRTIKYDDETESTDGISQEQARLMRFANAVIDYIQSTGAYNNMSPAEGGYL